MYWKQRATLGVSVLNRNDLADYDYLTKLSHTELKWLKGFNREFVNADFKHKYTRLIKGKKKRKSVYDANNARYRDLYNQTKWSNLLYLNPTVRDRKNQQAVDINMEDIMIEYLDNLSLQLNLARILK